MAQNIRLFILKTFYILFRRKRCYLKIAVPEFQKYKKITFNFNKIFWKINININFFKDVFQGFCLLFGNTDFLKEHPWVVISVYFDREVSKGSTFFLGIYYSQEYLNVKIPYSKLFQREYIFTRTTLTLRVKVSSEQKFWSWFLKFKNG